VAPAVLFSGEPNRFLENSNLAALRSRTLKLPIVDFRRRMIAQTSEQKC